MAVSKEIVALELALQKVVSYEQMSKKSALIGFFLELNSLFSLMEAQIKLGTARFQILPYLEKLHTHPLVKNNIRLIAEQLKTYPELLKLINQNAIDLKTKLQQELSVQARAGSAIRDPLSKQTQLDIEYLAFFSSLLPIFHAPNEVQGIIDKRINFLFVIAQYVPEVLVALVQTTKLRLYHGNLFNYLLGSYFFTSFSDSILFKMELELLPPIAELAHLEQNLEDLISCYEAIKRFFYEQLSLVGAVSIGYGAVANNYPALPLVNQKLVDHIKEQIKTLKRKNPSTEQLELLNTLAKKLEHYRKWPELFASFSQNLQDALIKLRTQVLNLDYETLAYKLITVYQCDPQPSLLATLASSLLEHIKASSDKKIQAGLSTVLATVYRLMQTQKIKILAVPIPNLSQLVQEELDSEASHTAAMKSYTFAPSLPPIPLLTKDKVFTATKKQVAMVSAYLQYFYDHQEECPAHVYYVAFINWLSKVNLKQELYSSHLFEMVHLLYTLNFAQYNEDYAQQISALLVHQLEQTKNKQNKRLYASLR